MRCSDQEVSWWRLVEIWVSKLQLLYYFPLALVKEPWWQIISYFCQNWRTIVYSWQSVPCWDRKVHTTFVVLNWPTKCKYFLLLLFFCNCKRCTAASVIRLFCKTESRSALSRIVSQWTLTETIAVWRKIRWVIAPVNLFSSFRLTIAVVAVVLFFCLKFAWVLLVPLVFRLLVFLLWMFSRWRRVWCFLPHCLHFDLSQFSYLCPNRRQLKHSFLNLSALHVPLPKVSRTSRIWKSCLLFHNIRNVARMSPNVCANVVNFRSLGFLSLQFH